MPAFAPLATITPRNLAALEALAAGAYSPVVTGKDCPMTATKGLVVPARGGKHHEESPGRITALKLLGHETAGSIMMFEQTVPAGTKSWFHLHHDSDEIGWVLDGEMTFKIGDEVTTGGPGTCAF